MLFLDVLFLGLSSCWSFICPCCHLFEILSTFQGQMPPSPRKPLLIPGRTVLLLLGPHMALSCDHFNLCLICIPSRCSGNVKGVKDCRTYFELCQLVEQCLASRVGLGGKPSRINDASSRTRRLPSVSLSSFTCKVGVTTVPTTEHL